MENLNTSHISTDDRSNPSQPFVINVNNTSKYNFHRAQSPALEKPARKKVPLHSYSTSNIGLASPLPARTSHQSTAGTPSTLNFSKKELTKVPKVIMEHISSLLTLDLSRNHFTEFPTEILQLTSLKSLKMESNYLKRIPSEIYQLSQLENISLASNYIVLIPKTIARLSKTLQVLNLSNNHIEVLPKELTELTSLKTLYIQCNFFIALPIQFNELTNLRELGLEWFKYTNPPLSVIQNDNSRFAILKLFQLCKTLSNYNKTEVNFEDFVNYCSMTKENIFSMRDPLHRNLLHIATLEQEIGIVRYLATYKEEFLNELDQDGQTALSLAIREEKYFIARILLLHGADPKLGGGAFGSALHMVTSKHQAGMVKELLKHGANPNTGDLEGNTPLHLLFSVFSKNLEVSKEIAQLLVDYGADPNQLNNDLWTPLHLAIRRGQTDCLRWVVETNNKNKAKEKKLFNLDARGGSDKWAPLHLAANLSQYEIINILLENNVDVMVKTKMGKTPRDVAMSNPLIMKVLKKMEVVWSKTHLVNPKTAPVPQNNQGLKNNVNVMNLENIVPNVSRAQQLELRGKISSAGSARQSSGAKIRNASSGGMRTGGSSYGNIIRASLRLDTQEKENFEEDKRGKRRDVNKDLTEDSLMIGDIDEVAESKEITRVMPKSPNNIQKLQIAQNYRNHLMNLLSDNVTTQGNMLRGGQQISKASTRSRVIGQHGIMAPPQKENVSKNVPKPDLGQQFAFPNEFSKYIRKFDNYMDEIKGFQNAILSENENSMPLCEKLKHLFYMKVIHMKLNQIVKKIHSELIPFELFIICESIDDEMRKVAFSNPTKSTTLQNNKDTIMRSLLFVFENLDVKNLKKNMLIKAKICQFFGDFRYTSAKHFLQQLLQNKEESLFLRLETQAALKILQNPGLTTARSLLLSKENSVGLMLGSPKNEFFSQPLTQIVKASFLSPTGTSTISAVSSVNFSKHKRPLSYYGNCENVDEDEEGGGISKPSTQNTLGKKSITEFPKHDETATLNDDSQEIGIQTEASPRIKGGGVFSRIESRRKIEVKGAPAKLRLEGYFSQH